MGEQNQGQTFRSSEIEFKINLSKQIDRIAALFSENIDARHTNLRLAQRMHFDDLMSAVNILEAMMTPYHDDIYTTASSAIKKPDEKKLHSCEEAALEKFRAVISLMDRNGLLLMKRETVTESLEDDTNVDEL